jgi:hypothetical protein
MIQNDKDYCIMIKVEERLTGPPRDHPEIISVLIYS